MDIYDQETIKGRTSDTEYPDRLKKGSKSRTVEQFGEPEMRNVACYGKALYSSSYRLTKVMITKKMTMGMVPLF